MRPSGRRGTGFAGPLAAPPGGSAAGAGRFDDLANILFDQAMLAEGGHLDDPAAYVARVTKLLSA